MDMETIGYFLFMEQAEKAQIENRSPEAEDTSREDRPPKKENRD